MRVKFLYRLIRSLIYVNIRLYYIKLAINRVLDKIKEKYYIFYLNKNIMRIL